jgi:hypothetical protein
VLMLFLVEPETSVILNAIDSYAIAWCRVVMHCMLIWLANWWE